MGFKFNSAKKVSDRHGGLREKYSSMLAGIKLRRPELPQVPGELPENLARKYPVFQELAAARQEIQDEFSKWQVGFEDVKTRLGDDLAPVPKSGPAKTPEQAGARSPAEHRDAAKPPAAQAAPGSRSAQNTSGQDVSSPLPLPGDVADAGSRPFPSFVFLAAAVCAAAFGFFRFFGGSAESPITLPPTRAAGLCLDRDGKHVFFADPQRQLLFSVSVPEKRVKSMQSFPAQGLKGLAFDGTSFWSTDGTSIFRHGLAGSYAVLGVNKAGPEISSLCWDGKNLWAASAGGKLTRYAAGDALVQEAVYPLPEGRTAGISVSDGKLWLLDPESGKLSAYKLGVKPEFLDAADIKSKLPAGAISGFSVSGDHLWVITAEPAELARINLRSMKFF